jgi:hypothetical protein
VIAVLALAVVAAAGLVVEGEGRDGCPRASDVAARVRAVLPEQSTAATLVIAPRGEGLWLRLFSATGALREERTLVVRGTCAELADAAANVAVAWQVPLAAPIHPPAALVPVHPPSVPASEVAVVQAETARDERLRPPGLRELSAAMHAAIGAHRWAPGITLEAVLGPVFHERLAVFAAIGADAPRSEVLEAKRWSWMRVFAAFGGMWRVPVGRWTVAAHAGVGAEELATTSESLSIAQSYQLVWPTVTGGARLSYRREGVTPWIGLAATSQLRRTLTSPVNAADISPERSIVQLSVGAAFGPEVLP